MHRNDLFYRLELNDHFIFNDKICSESLIKFYSIKNNWHRHLPINIQSSSL